MDQEQLRRLLDDQDAARPWLTQLRLADTNRAHANLVRIAGQRVTLDLVAVILDQLARLLPAVADPDMALNNLERYIGAARNPLSLATLFQRDPEALAILVRLFSTSQHLGDILIADPEAFDVIQQTQGRPMHREQLVGGIVSEIDALDRDASVLRALRRFKRRQTLRIAFADIVQQRSLRMVTRQISYLADALIEGALHAAKRALIERHGVPRGPNGAPAQFVVLALGKLGGEELNYSSDIDLILLYDVDGQTDHRRSRSNAEFFGQLAREMVRLLTEMTDLGAVYRVDLRLRPDGQRGPVVISSSAALRYYDTRGRTWERQAMIKARSAAGALGLGEAFLADLSPWIWRRFLTRADIDEIRVLKQRIEKRAAAAAGVTRGEQEAYSGRRDVKTGWGGIRDIEFVIQFLQLLNGGDLPAIRTGNTLDAMARLEDCGCLSHQESGLLRENYSFLRNTEHRLQLLFDMQTHVLPDEPRELEKLAVRMGCTARPQRTAREEFETAFAEKTALNRRILDHLLHEAFPDQAKTRDEVDLILAPEPSEAQIAEVLGRYAFRDVKTAYRHLASLAEERSPFLSTRRCRHFFAAIVPSLLEAIGVTPDPDATLMHLSRVSDSLGGKGVLWELFSFNPPSLALYVRICAYSEFVVEMLDTHPGMLDGLMDSLVLDQLPSPATMRAALTEVCRGAEDITPMLHGFKNDHLLQVAVRDILGKSDLATTAGAISDIAQCCLSELTRRAYRGLVEKLGRPMLDLPSGARREAEFIILGLGKLGGREMAYFSDLDIVFLYEDEGETEHGLGAASRETTTNQHFFAELGQRIITAASRPSVYGRLYEVDARLRPTGKSGPLAVSLETFERYYADGGAALWERQSLCRARVVFGSQRIVDKTMDLVQRAIFSQPWEEEHAKEILSMRRRLEKSVAPKNFKRGPGGIVDVEFLVQALQLRYGRKQPSVCDPNVLAALDALREAEQLSPDDHALLRGGYTFLREVELRLQLMNRIGGHTLPEDPVELMKLSHLMRSPSVGGLKVRHEQTLSEIRERFLAILDA